MNTSQAPFRIAIVGGAIGGLTTALFLDHFCRTVQPDPHTISIDVYEQAAEYREIGAGVGIGINAAKLMHKIPGVGEAMRSIQGRPDNSWFTFVRWDNGRRITHVDTPVNKDDPVRPSSMARSEFLEILLEKIRERGVAKLHTKKRFASCKVCEKGVLITFADETTAEADLLIGSDGIHSEVRKQFITGKALYSGKIAYRGVVPISQLPHDTWPGRSSSGDINYAVIWLARHKHFLVFPISRTKSLNVVAFISKREEEIPDLRESWTSTCDRSELEEDFKDCEETVQGVIRLMPDRPSKWRINDHEPVSQWHFLEGKVALVGDACHATTPHQGAGAGQAVEDGYIVSKALAEWMTGGRRAPLEAWMGLYQRIRLPRAQRVVTTSRQAGALYEFESPDLIDLPFEEAEPIVVERLQSRMRWIWEEDIDSLYAKQREEAGL
ncbi:FAD/NAD(P)-binding domain-containing protein [Cryphonectria parasitica EP155]|uniref:FAD/NAD(P)-binding domain-containing protein n=1 Tax=Cryphonectria parasitica (strain ATCC 38755 / EP155) TaxID=660469 RepID=A0A9P4XUL8_CRYP1|nr:FAD/NAD(P)-binding domain-containing protein [Cryphonectria parasitica EP155]KAF3760920.1 FAD/NAD(P)-binding domain-containing protein [Cryphonectria parasitica EP155]